MALALFLISTTLAAGPPGPVPILIKAGCNTAKACGKVLVAKSDLPKGVTCGDVPPGQEWKVWSPKALKGDRLVKAKKLVTKANAGNLSEMCYVPVASMASGERTYEP